ncbi:DUF5753 domain-containing protein [Streptomyces sp. NBC_01515]|uniref:Scr1 family TA system antitoxin-like transcriptional regulator n=1 Tax=Streptomyces sp. NBC_01515 TaxID=2903890 RepID=UPI003862FDBF
MTWRRRATRSRQILGLLEESERSSVTLRVLPFTCEEFIEATDAPTYAGGVVPQLDTVQLDSPTGSFYLGAEVRLNKYRMLLDIAERSSLSEAESRQLIHHIAREL